MSNTNTTTSAATAAGKTILAIGAHVGDMELTAGALLASCAVAGGRAVTLALTAGEPGIQSAGNTIYSTEMLALNIYNTFYQNANTRGIGQAKAVIFFLLVAVIALAQLYATRRKEVQQ